MLIANNHHIVIEGIKSILRDCSDFEVIGEAVNGIRAVEQVVSLRPEIAIMGISLPELNGIDATLQVKRLVPETKIIVYTVSRAKEDIVELFKAGVSAYVFGGGSASELILALRAVKSGGTYLSKTVPEILVGHMRELEKNRSGSAGLENLSLRERELFHLLAEGETVQAISKRLNISPKTVQSHKYNIMEKIGAHNITELVRFALRNELIRL